MMSIVYHLGEQKIVALDFEKVAQDVGIEFVEREVSKYYSKMTEKVVEPHSNLHCFGSKKVRMVSPTSIVRWGEWVVSSFVKCIELFQ